HHDHRDLWVLVGCVTDPPGVCGTRVILGSARLSGSVNARIYDELARAARVKRSNAVVHSFLDEQEIRWVDEILMQDRGHKRQDCRWALEYLFPWYHASHDVIDNPR